ncbi:MAG: cell division protein FtsA, partial [Sphingobium sp.]
MGSPRVEKLITAIDVGSWKVSALIAGRQEDGSLVILGTGQRESKGVRRGFIADMERTEQAIRETVEQAEKVAGTNIETVHVSFSGGSLVSDV